MSSTAVWMTDFLDILNSFVCACGDLQTLKPDTIWLKRRHGLGIWSNSGGLGRWCFMTRKWTDPQSADVFGIYVFVAMTSRWISAVTKRRLLGFGLNAFPCKACPQITFAWWAGDHVSLANLREALGPDWSFSSPLSIAARVTDAYLGKACSLFICKPFFAKNSLLDELLNPIYKIRTVQISSWTLLSLWYVIPMSAGGEKQRDDERPGGDGRKEVQVNKGHFSTSEIPRMLVPLGEHLE